MQEVEKLIVYFTIYCFIGWLCEVIYCSLLSHKFVNRGFLAGPVCPVYGFGALFVIWLLRPVAVNVPITFLSGLVITSTIEYITGWLLEVFFGTRWWDYSNERFNLEGRVCLKNSVFFGILSVLLMQVLHPFSVYFVEMIPDLGVMLISITLLAAFIADSGVTLYTVANLNQRLKRLSEFTEELRKNADIAEWFNEHEFFKSFEKLKIILEEGKNEINHKFEESKNELNRKLREKFEVLTQKRGSGDRIIKAFPNMKSIRYDKQLNHLKEALKEIKNKAKLKKLR